VSEVPEIIACGYFLQEVCNGAAPSRAIILIEPVAPAEEIEAFPVFIES
jgi:hypothetical protein